ncbi:PIG-L family deacetylase [Robiginitalea sp. M366]|uniref:PIG-L family deacetylase n=1 Tax=Robiginitalea aestuariiviva TaxID=3036903 RepID=UPI00240E22C1|nr:PIG-L family deacetylase [Robiginitalea aestuariiviva]MDG1572788.1 PIG-L family deacetylase [Robiginitalea aestuariiviva]
MRLFLVCAVLWVALPATVIAQGPKPPSAVQLYNDLQDLNFLGTALYVAAHPDDENTRLISYLSNAVHARTAYLSMTRGDGGQNLIGTELRELLGVLRTQELLAARGVDGGEQFFTRAVDFGYSKHPDETLRIWDKQQVLSDVVRIIRQYRPDVVINRFDHRTPGSTHGHHTSSAMLSTEAFELAADPAAFPEQLQSLQPWQPKRLYHNTSWWFYGSPEAFEEAVDAADLVRMDVGVYYPERGLSNNEIASLASSQHLCQGFGRPLSRGSEPEFLELIKGSAPGEGNDLFAGINTTWSRIPGGEAVGEILEPLEKHFNFADPSQHLPELLKAYTRLEQLNDTFWKPLKLQALQELIAGVCGLYLEASSREATGVPGSQAEVSLELLNRSGWPVHIKGIAVENGTRIDSAFTLEPNIRRQMQATLSIPANHPGTSPYWLRQPGSLGLYQVPDAAWIGKPQTPPAFNVQFEVDLDGQAFTFSRPVIHRYSEPDKGERYRAFDVVPPVTAAFGETVMLFADAHPKAVQLRVKSQTGKATGTVSLDLPQGWIATPASQPYVLEGKGDEQVFQFSLMPPEGASEGEVRPQISFNGKIYAQERVEIDYDHIPTQTVLMPAQVKVVRLQVEKAGQHIGYVMGAGDALPQALEAIGYTVHPLATEDITEENLKPLDAVVLGIRAYNVLDDLPFKNPALLEYVKAGGTLVVQYNTSGRGNRDFSSLAPYPLQLSRDRVSDEDAQVTLLEPNHPLLSFPNTIGEADFNGWVQERGLYFPDQWDAAYTPLLSMQDPGEPARKGSLLVAPYGEGHYIYTGLSFFREMPAGVSGAFKLFANMLSIGKAKLKTDAVKG